MAEEPYGTFFPENIGPLFTGQLPGQNPVLNKLGNLYQETPQIATPVVNQLSNVTGPIPAGPPVQEVGPNFIPTGGSEVDILEQFKPETRAQDEYFNLIKNLPQRQEPTRGQRILAGLSTLGQGGLQQAENVKYGNYNRQVADMKLKADMLKELSSSERAANTNERMIMNQLLTERRADRRQDEIERKNRETGEQANRRLQLQQFKAENPNATFVRLGTGNWGFTDPATGKITDSGVKYGLSPLEDILMERGSTRERQETQADFDRRMEEQRQENRLELERYQAQLKLALQKQENLSPNDRKTLQYLKAREIATSWGPDAAKMIRYDDASNSFRIAPPAEWDGIFGIAANPQKTAEAAELWIKANKFIYGDNWTPPANIQGRINPPTPAPTAGRARQNTPPVPVNSTAARRAKAKAVLEQRKLDTSDASIDTFLKNNPNFR